MWIREDFIVKDLYAPFILEYDKDYYKDLCKRYEILSQVAITAGADEESLSIIKKYTAKIEEAVREYYKGEISKSHNIVKNLVKGCLDSKLAVSELVNCEAFGGEKGTEIQFFRARISRNFTPYKAQDMLHIPFDMRGKTGNFRFSIIGVPSLYLCNTSYACWIELGKPSEHDFVVSPVITDGRQKVLNLAVNNRYQDRIRTLEDVHCWLKLFILMIATSYRIEEEREIFKSEYIISQSIMLACNELDLDGLVYYSKRVEDQMFAEAAINVALFAKYKRGKRYSPICEHIKIGNSFNYSMYKQLNNYYRNKEYPLRCLHTGKTNNIGDYDHQYWYRFTEFCEFDKFLFAEWKKDEIPFGNAVCE